MESTKYKSQLEKNTFQIEINDARLGFEPRLMASKATVLPLDDRANHKLYYIN